jgi:hypothetical protein
MPEGYFAVGPESSATSAIAGVLTGSRTARNPEIDVYIEGYIPLISYPEAKRKLNDDL